MAGSSCLPLVSDSRRKAALLAEHRDCRLDRIDGRDGPATYPGPLVERSLFGRETTAAAALELKAVEEADGRDQDQIGPARLSTHGLQLCGGALVAVLAGGGVGELPPLRQVPVQERN